MIIPSRKLLPYFEAMSFPVTVLEEKSDIVAKVATQIELLGLIAREEVVGHGSWNRIKKIRLNRPIEETSIAPQEKEYPSSSTAFARTNMGVYRQPLSEPIIEREFEDDPHVVGAGEVFAHAYAFCSLSRQEGRLVGL